MVFTVSPAAHVSCPSDVGAGGEGASAISSGFFSEDLSVYNYCGRSVSVDPFSASVVDRAGDSDGGGLCVEPALRDFWRGGDCRMDLGGIEWSVFCRDFLLVDGGSMRSQSDLVILIDGVLNGIVDALTGCGEYGDRSAGSSARLMQFVGQLYVLLVLCGGVGVLPPSVAFERYGGCSVGGRGFPCRVMRRLTSLGRCARGLIRAAWPFGLWVVDGASDMAVLRKLGLEGYAPRVPFWMVWRAAVVDRAEGLGLLMNEVVGPAFHGGYQSLVSHEYDLPSGGVGPPSGGVSCDLMHGCYTLLVSRVGVEYGSSRKGAESLGRVWLLDFYDGCMCGKGCGLRADESVARRMLALFNVSVKRGGRGSFSFCVGGRSVWEAHAVGVGEMTCGVFCSSLVGGLSPGGMRSGLGVIGSGLVSDSGLDGGGVSS